MTALTSEALARSKLLSSVRISPPQSSERGCGGQGASSDEGQAVMPTALSLRLVMTLGDGECAPAPFNDPFAYSVPPLRWMAPPSTLTTSPAWTVSDWAEPSV